MLARYQARNYEISGGRVLAGENKSPGSFSLRTLEFLKNLSKQEAIEVAKFSQFAVSDVVLRGNEALLEAEGINLNTLLRMEELGVVTGVESVGLVRTLSSRRADRFERTLVSHSRVLVVRHDDATKKLLLKVWALTQVGREVIRLGTFEANEAYLRSLGVAIRGRRVPPCSLHAGNNRLRKGAASSRRKPCQSAEPGRFNLGRSMIASSRRSRARPPGHARRRVRGRASGPEFSILAPRWNTITTTSASTAEMFGSAYLIACPLGSPYVPHARRDDEKDPCGGPARVIGLPQGSWTRSVAGYLLEGQTEAIRRLLRRRDAS